MADFYKGLVDAWGRPIEKSTLTQEVAAASITGVRSPLTGYPGDGLTPERLAMLLRSADQGEPLAYLELAETIEERDLHYAGVLGTRKRSVSQLDITVEAASDDERDQDDAEMVREWLTRDELADETFDMLDAVGKGYSATEIIWDTSEGQWRPERLEWRDPRWFRFDPVNGTTPAMLDDHGQRIPLPGFKFIFARIKAKSGLPVRSGIARIVAWAWMFKAYTQRDWAIFTQTYGQPVRLGKYGPGATEDDRNTLYNAVANIATDCAAIMPESMQLEFVEAKNLGTGHANYRERSDWLDQQVSKAVLGQTATTDAIAGGHAVGKEHREVQEDIERADAKALAAVINRDLIRPWIQLERGPQKRYPRVKIGRAEELDVQRTVESVARLIPLGLKVGANQMRDVIGIGAPGDDDELLGTGGTGTTPPGIDLGDGRDKDKTPLATARAQRLPVDAIAEDAARQDGAGALLTMIRAMAGQAASLEELAAMLEAAGGSPTELEDAMRNALLLGELTGRFEIGGDG